jgi:hypothetical protein
MGNMNFSSYVVVMLNGKRICVKDFDQMQHNGCIQRRAKQQLSIVCEFLTINECVNTQSPQE